MDGMVAGSAAASVPHSQLAVGGSSPNAMDQDLGIEEGSLDPRQQAAVQMLQANSRGMLARRNFGRIKRQTLAMIVIQRTLVRRNRRFRGAGNARPPPAAHDSAEVAAYAPSRVGLAVVGVAPVNLQQQQMQQQQQHGAHPLSLPLPALSSQ